jgi:hypothetical protein
MKSIAKWFMIILMAGITNHLHAQSTDLARIEYTYFPQANSDNSFRRFRTNLNAPIKMNDKGAYLVPGVEYENINFKFEDETPFPKRGALDRFQSITATLGYTFKINETWRFGGLGGVILASNFENETIVRDDWLYTGAVFFIKNRDEKPGEVPTRLILGLHYSTTSGFPFPLPVVNYYREFHPNWSYTVGVPKSNLKYFLSERSELQAFVTLDGFYANIQRNRKIPDAQTLGESISMTIVLAGLGYEFRITDNLIYYLYGGHTLMNDIRIRDANRDNVYEINKVNTFYGRTGLKFSIL